MRRPNVSALGEGRWGFFGCHDSVDSAVVHLGLEGINPGLFTTRPVGLVHEGHELDTFLSSET